MRKILLPLVLAVSVSALLGSSACDDEDSPKLFTAVVEKKELMVGGGQAQIVRLGRGTSVVELDIPGNVAPVATRVQVSLVTGVVKRGSTPVP